MCVAMSVRSMPLLVSVGLLASVMHLMRMRLCTSLVSFFLSCMVLMFLPENAAVEEEDFVMT